jgi:hypothetical protein
MRESMVLSECECVCVCVRERKRKYVRRWRFLGKLPEGV